MGGASWLVRFGSEPIGLMVGAYFSVFGHLVDTHKLRPNLALSEIGNSLTEPLAIHVASSGLCSPSFLRRCATVGSRGRRDAQDTARVERRWVPPGAGEPVTVRTSHRFFADG